MSPFALHHESSVQLNATPEIAFAYLDNFNALSAHMAKRSMMMMGSRMGIATDDRKGRDVGSRVEMRGRVLGIPLSLSEIVTERDPPLRKAWETIDTSLVVIGPYRLGFELAPSDRGSRLRVFIDYDLPGQGFGRWVGKALGRTYARWCTRRMASDAATHFGTPALGEQPTL